MIYLDDFHYNTRLKNPTHGNPLESQLLPFTPLLIHRGISLNSPIHIERENKQ